MSFLAELFHGTSVAHTLLVLSAALALGAAIGRIRLFGISFGIAGVLFAGLLLGTADTSLPSDVLVFTRDLGLILFVYTIGMQVGPGFFASFRKEGLSLNLTAAIIGILGTVTAVAVGLIGRLPAPVTVGLLSGAVTNTPSLAAAQQAFSQQPNLPSDALHVLGASYAIAYPFGVLGTIFAMLLVRWMFRIDMAREAQAYAAQRPHAKMAPKNLNVELKNPQIAGQPVEVLARLIQPPVAVSRLLRGERVAVARPSMRLQMGDVLHAVGPLEGLEKLRLTVGDPAAVDLRQLPSDLTARQILVTQSDVLGETLEDLDLSDRYDVAVTRVERTGVEFVPTPSTRTQFGDRLTIVGTPDAIRKVAVELGNSLKRLDQPDLIAIGVGILLGVLVGSIPFPLPGLPAPVKLGLAGGPLVVAMVLSRIGRIGPIIWYLPQTANVYLREWGIAIFLACVGLRSGPEFTAAFLSGRGWLWMGWGALITFVPIALVALWSRAVRKMNYGVLCGLLAGSVTDPPALAFAHAAVPSEATTITYATVYPLATCLRIFAAQVLVFFLQ